MVGTSRDGAIAGLWTKKHKKLTQIASLFWQKTGGDAIHHWFRPKRQPIAKTLFL
jgi:hypothetical protein